MSGGDRRARGGAAAVRRARSTGAGDVFAAAYVWADLAGSPLAERLALSCLYASLSLRAPSVLRGALSLRELVRAADSHGVPMPPAAED